MLGYLPEGGYIILGEEDAPRAVAETLAEQGEAARDRLERDGENPHGLAPAFLPWAWLEPRIAARPQASFAALLTDEQRGADGLGGALAPDLTPAQSYGGRLRAFAHDVRRLLDERQRVVIVSLQARRLCEVFGDEALLGRAQCRARLAADHSARRARARDADGRAWPLPGGLAQPHDGADGLHRYGGLRLGAAWRAARAARLPRRRSWRSYGPATSSCIRTTASDASMGWSSWPAATSSASTC